MHIYICIFIFTVYIYIFIYLFIVIIHAYMCLRARIILAMLTRYCLPYRNMLGPSTALNASR